MEIGFMIMCGAFATVMILIALRIDHAEWLERRRKNGKDQDAA